MKTTNGMGFLVSAVLLLAGCGGGVDDYPAEGSQEPAAPAEAEARQAVAQIEAKGGGEVKGTATFSAGVDGVTLEFHLFGATPGTHAVHIHEFGDCSSEDGKSAGGHWNPGGVDHGQWGVQPFHLGDIGNVEADESGHAMLTLSTDLWSIGTGQDNDVLGRAVIVHAGTDDFTTQPTGAAGGRVGCGVIE